ncbi:DUF4193 domain-containing protein (plasmid) [Rhodococcus sp. USK10]|nr:DUF4193 domain-containing protein [Rhodococcus sp. USK10]
MAKNPDHRRTIDRHRPRHHSRTPGQQPCGEWDVQQPRSGPNPTQTDEFTCTSSVLVHHRSFLADPAQLFCRYCTRPPTRACRDPSSLRAPHHKRSPHPTSGRTHPPGGAAPSLSPVFDPVPAQPNPGPGSDSGWGCSDLLHHL